MEPEKHIFTVHSKDKVVDVNGKVHIPQKFLDFLNLKHGDSVVLALYMGDWTLRLRKNVGPYDRVHTEKTVDVSGKVYVPKSFGARLNISAGNRVVVELFEGPRPEIRIRKKREFY